MVVSFYFTQVSDRNTRKKCEICLELTIETLEPRHWRRYGVFIFSFEHVSHLFIVLLLVTLNK